MPPDPIADGANDTRDEVTALPAPDLEAELLFALIDGAAQHYVLEPNRYPLGDIENAIVERY